MNILVEMPRGYVTDTFLTPENIRRLEALGNVTWNQSEQHMSREEFRDALAGVDVCVCGWGVPRFDSYVLEKADRLKLVAYTAGSVSKVVSDDMYNKGIRIVCGNEAFGQSVAEGTIAYMLASLRRIPEMRKHMQTQGWRPERYLTESISDQTIGLVGLGAVSRYLIEMLKPFHVHIKLYSKHTSPESAEKMGVELAELEDIFSTCKIVSLHCARSPANYHLVNDRLLSMMQPNALLINTARGDIIDEAALVRHLEQEHIRAVLDVYEVEPLPLDSPLRGQKNALLIPHMGGPAIDRRPYCAKLVLEDIERLQKGQALENEITPSRANTMTK